MNYTTSKTLTVEQVAEQLNISRASAYILVNKSDFPKIRIGKRIIIPADAFDSWLIKNTEGE